MFLKNKVTLHLVVTIFLLLGAIFFLLYLSNLYTPAVKSIIVARLKQQFNREIEVDQVTTNFISRLTLHNVRLAESGGFGQGTILSCRKIVIHYFLWDVLTKKRQWLKNIKEIDLIEPVMEVNNFSGDWNIKKITMPTTGKTDLLTKIVVKNGLVNIHDTSGRWENIKFRRLNCQILPQQKEKWKISLKVIPSHMIGERLALVGEVNSASGSFTGEIDIKKGNLINFNRLVPSLTKIKIDQGIFNLQAKINGRLGDFSSIDYQGQIDLKNASCQIPSIFSSSFTNIGGLVTFDKNNFYFQNLNGLLNQEVFLLSGQINQYLTAPLLNLQLIGEQVEIDSIRKIVISQWAKKVDLQGKGKLNIQITGPFEKISLKGDLNVSQGRINFCDFNKLTAQIEYFENNLLIHLIQASIADGILKSQGKINFNTTPANIGIKVNLSRIDLAKVITGKMALKGLADLQCQIGGTGEKLIIKGESTLADLRLNQKEIGKMVAKFQYKENRIEISGQTFPRQDKYTMVTSFKQDGLKIDNFNWIFANLGQITIKGDLSLTPNKKIDFIIGAQDIPAKDLNIFINRVPVILGGSFDFTGELKGTLNQPQLDGKLSSKKITINENLQELSGQITLDKKHLQIRDFQIGQAYKGNLKIIFDKQPWIEGYAKITGGELEKWHKQLQGKINGTVQVKGQFDKLQASGNLAASDIKIARLQLTKFVSNFTLQEGRVLNFEFRALQNEGVVKGRTYLELKKQQNNNISAVLELDNFKIPSLMQANLDQPTRGIIKFEGKLNYNGETKIWGEVKSTDFQINQQAQTIKAKIYYQHSILEINYFNLGEEYSFKGKVDFTGQVPYAEGELSIQIADLQKQAFLWNWPKDYAISGSLTGGIIIKGPINNPTLWARIDARNGTIRRFNYERWSGLVAVQNKIANIKNMEIYHGKETYLIKGSFATGTTQQTPLEDLNLNINFSQSDLANLAGLWETQNNLQGLINGDIKIKGTWNNPVLEGSLVSYNYKYKDWALRNITCDFKYSDKILDFSSLTAEENGAKFIINSPSHIEFITNKNVSYNLTLTLRNINYQGLTIFGGIKVKGNSEFIPEGIKGVTELVIDDLWVNQHQFEKSSWKIKYQPREYEFIPVKGVPTQLTGKIEERESGKYYLKDIVIIRNGQKVFLLQGEIQKNGQVNLVVASSRPGLAVQDIVELLDFKIPFSGTALFSLRLTGEIANPQVTGSFNFENGKLNELSYDNFTGLFQIKDKIIDLKQCRLTRKNKYNLQATGSIPLTRAVQTASAMNLDLILNKSSLEFLTIASSDIKKATGEMEGRLHITGNLDEPIFNGELQATNGEIFSNKITKKISNLEAELVVVNNKININQLTAQMGEGTLEVKGFVVLKNWAADNFDLKIITPTNKGVAITLAGFVEKGEPKFDVHLYGNSDKYHLDGKVELVNARFTYPPKTSKQSPSYDFLDHAIWNLQVVGGDNTWFENNLVNVNVRGALKFVGDEKDVVVSGQVEAIRGEGEYLGTEFKIIQANLEFFNDTAYLSGKAEAMIGDDVVTMTINKAELEKVRPRFSSKNNPQMAEEKVISLLVYGEQAAKLTPEDQNKLLVKEVLRLMDNTLSTKIIRPVIKKMGLAEVVDTVKIKTMVAQQSSDANKYLWEGSQVTLGKYLTNRIYLGYSTILQKEGLTSRLELKHAIEMDYRLKGSQYLKMRLSQEERFMGIENQIRF